LQRALLPVLSRVPREVGGTTVFTANAVTYARMSLVLPIAACLKLHQMGCQPASAISYSACAALLILWHDLLDHVDGIVAKAQAVRYGPADDQAALWGGFVDAMADKFVFILTSVCLLMVTDYTATGAATAALTVTLCLLVIAYELALAVVRTNDYFHEAAHRLARKRALMEMPATVDGALGNVDGQPPGELRAAHGVTNGRIRGGIGGGDATTHADALHVGRNVSAVMEGKLKQKFESVGMALLALAQPSPSVHYVAGSAGMLCLALASYFSHKSLAHKLAAYPRFSRYFAGAKPPK
jgi:phosphatidylglycerophosphate synthase